MSIVPLTHGQTPSGTHFPPLPSAAGTLLANSVPPSPQTPPDAFTRSTEDWATPSPTPTPLPRHLLSTAMDLCSDCWAHHNTTTITKKGESESTGHFPSLITDSESCEGCDDRASQNVDDPKQT